MKESSYDESMERISVKNREAGSSASLNSEISTSCIRLSKDSESELASDRMTRRYGAVDSESRATTLQSERALPCSS